VERGDPEGSPERKDQRRYAEVSVRSYMRPYETLRGDDEGNRARRQHVEEEVGRKNLRERGRRNQTATASGFGSAVGASTKGGGK